MPLDPALAAIAAPHFGSRAATEAVIFALCWPNDSAFTDALAVPINQGESLDAAAERLDFPFHPQWLEDAGYIPFDSSGVSLADGGKATSVGPIDWQPLLRLCRVDDQVKDSERNNPSGTPYRRRLAGEVAVLALWSSAAASAGIDLNDRPTNLDRNTRGALFKNLLVFLLQDRLPTGWRVEPEVYLTDIRGLHMRQNVGGRRSDIVVIDDGNRLVAVVSSKWTWRSDRGTEAAQMVPLMRYRPDVPYALVTAEFPRSSTVGRESIEDRAYHVCPEWVGAWLAINRLSIGSVREAWPTLDSVRQDGLEMAETLGLSGLHDLIDHLTDSGTIL